MQLVRGETVRLARLLGDLPGEALQEREYCRRIGLLSNQTVPISVGGQPVCALVIGAFRDARDWPDPVVDRVRLIGQVLANALHRRRVEAELHKAVAELEQTKFRKRARPKGAGSPLGQQPSGSDNDLESELNWPVRLRFNPLRLAHGPKARARWRSPRNPEEPVGGRDRIGPADHHHVARWLTAMLDHVHGGGVEGVRSATAGHG